MIEQTKNWIEKNGTRLWFSVLFNLLIFGAMILFMRPWYETNDDINIQIIVNGAKGAFDAHTMCQNYFLGLWHCFLYDTFGTGISWYALTQHVVLIISFTSITYVLMNRFKKRIHGLTITLVLLLYFGYECYIKMQYTKTSGIATCAAALLLFHAVSREVVSLKELVFAIFLGLVGFLYRYNEFASCAALMTGIGLFLLLDIGSFPKTQRIKRMLLGMAGYAVMCGAAFGLYQADLAVYNQDPQWAYYNEYNNLRSTIIDYGFPKYSENKEAYNELGINKHAYRLFSRWNFNDTEKFNVESMKKILEMREEKPLNAETAKQFLEKFPWSFFGTRTLYFALLMAGIWLFWGKHNYKTWLTALYEISIFMVLYFFLFYFGRYLMNRVDTAYWLAVSLTFTWLLSAYELKLSRQSCGIFAAAVFLMSLKTWDVDLRINMEENKRENAQHQEVFRTISADKEHLYLVKVGVLNCAYYGPYDTMPVGFLDNVIWLGGWETQMVNCIEIMENYGVVNPYRDMVGNEEVYLVDNDIKTTMKYINSEYDKDAEAVLVNEIGGYSVYQIKS